MRRISGWILGSVLSSFIVMACPAAASEPTATDEAVADDDTDEIFEEIVVTARKREENLQEIPISVTAFTATDLEARSLFEINDLDTFTPNLNFSVTGGFGDEASESTVFMRGVGQLQAQRFNTDSGVGIYVDSVFVARSQGAVFELLDLERIEILRGPQGTLFGRNAIGGAISLVTKKPRAEFGARLEATTGQFSRADLKGSVSGRLAEKLAASLTAMSAHRDGFSKSLWTGQEFQDVDRDAARLSLVWDPSASVSIHGVGDFTRKREAGGNMLLLNVDQVPLVAFFNDSMAAAGRPTYTNEWVPDRLDRSYSGFDSFIDGDIFGTSVSATWTRGDFALQSITAYRGFDVASQGDGDGTPALFAERERFQRQDQFSQELQFSGLALDDKLTWQAGGLYFRERPREIGRGIIFRDLFDTLESLPGAIISPPGAPNFLCDPGPQPPGVPCFGGAGNPFNLAFTAALDFQILDMTTVSTAVFGEASWALTDRAELTFGLRYSRDDKEMVRSGRKSPLGEPNREERTDKEAWDAWTPRLSFAFQLKPDVLLYASASRGFKSGGFDFREIDRAEGFASFRPELMWTYEIGFKSEFFGHRLRLNESTFYSDYKDIQFVVAESFDGIPAAIIKNAGTAEIFGFELELEAQPVPRLLLTAGIGYTDADLVEIDPNSGIPLGTPFPKTPDWNYNVALQYAFSAGDRGSVIARADYGWSGEFFHDFLSSEASKQESYGILNTRLVYAPNDRFEVAAFGTNVTDEAYLESALLLDLVGTTLGVAGRPREWGLTFQVRW